MSEVKFSLFDLPIHDVPVFEEKQGKDYVEYGQADEYGTYLEQLYLGSSIHGAIVNGVGEMIYGEGLDAKNKDANDDSKEQWVKLTSLISRSEKDILKKLALDLKLYGQCYVNTIWNRSRTRIVEMRHVPVRCLRAGIADSDGDIPLWYYKNDWTKRREQPLVYKKFCLEDRAEASRILQIKRYAPSFHYYGLPDYIGSTGYVELDQQIQNFHLNNIKNGMFPSMLISFNQGIPTDEEQRMIEAKVNDKFGGAEGAGKVLITFNDGAENAPTFTPVQNNGTDGMYEYLSSEVNGKVLSGHRVTSPLLFGIRGDGSGFGNNADELRDSYSLFHHSVVVPMQEILLQGLQPVFSTLGVSLDLYFVPLKPADFLGLSVNDDVDTGEVERSYTGIQISAALDIVSKVELGELSKPQGIQLLVAMLGFTEEAAREMFLPEGTSEPAEATFSSDVVDGVADGLIDAGSPLEMDGYELVDERKVDYELEDVRDNLHTFAKVVSGGYDGESKDDTPLFKVRYQYAPLKINQGKKAGSREFCKKMVEAAKVYKKEDILKAGKRVVNAGFGEGGKNTYSVWKFKGGPRCHHYWMRLTYLKKDDERISRKQAQKMINEIDPAERGPYRIKKNAPEVAKLPNDMKHKGFSPNNPNLPSDAK
jgi:hypothetical protein